MSNRRKAAVANNNERCKKCRQRAHWLVRDDGEGQPVVVCGWCLWQRPLPHNVQVLPTGIERR